MPSTTTTIRISVEARDRLRRLAEQEGASMAHLLDEAVDVLSRQKYFERFNESYRRLREDDQAWQEELAEREAWDGVLADGLEDDEYEA